MSPMFDSESSASSETAERRQTVESAITFDRQRGSFGSTIITLDTCDIQEAIRSERSPTERPRTRESRTQESERPLSRYEADLVVSRRMVRSSVGNSPMSRNGTPYFKGRPSLRPLMEARSIEDEEDRGKRLVYNVALRERKEQLIALHHKLQRQNKPTLRKTVNVGATLAAQRSLFSATPRSRRRSGLGTLLVSCILLYDSE